MPRFSELFTYYCKNFLGEDSQTRRRPQIYNLTAVQNSASHLKQPRVRGSLLYEFKLPFVFAFHISGEKIAPNYSSLRHCHQ